MHKITDFTPIGTIAGRRFYEHPIHGDEAGVLMEYAGKFFQLDYYEVPDKYEVMDILDCVREGYYSQVDQYGRGIK